MKKPWVLSYPLSAQRSLWSDWADAQANLSLCWAQSFCWFCHEVGYMLMHFPVMSPPSRILPQRAWAAAMPTLLSHEAFDTLLNPSILQQLPFHIPLSPLERFLGCNFIRRHLLRMITIEKHVSRDMTKPTKWVCAQRRLRSAWASAQSDLSLRWAHEETLGP